MEHSRRAAGPPQRRPADRERRPRESEHSRYEVECSRTKGEFKRDFLNSSRERSRQDSLSTASSICSRGMCRLSFCLPENENGNESREPITTHGSEAFLETVKLSEVELDAFLSRQPFLAIFCIRLSDVGERPKSSASDTRGPERAQLATDLTDVDADIATVFAHGSLESDRSATCVPEHRLADEPHPPAVAEVKIGFALIVFERFNLERFRLFATVVPFALVLAFAIRAVTVFAALFVFVVILGRCLVAFLSGDGLLLLVLVVAPVFALGRLAFRFGFRLYLCALLGLDRERSDGDMGEKVD